MRDDQRGRHHGLELSTGSLARLERVDHAAGERQLGSGLEARDHDARDLRRPDDVGDGGTVSALGLALLATHIVAGVGGGAAGGIDDGELAPIPMRGRGDDPLHGLAGGEPAPHEVERKRTEPRIGAVLGQDGADAGPGMRAARADRYRGCRNGGAQHSGPGAAPDERERHDEPSAITAVMSTSISSSGLASPFTIDALKAGSAPLSLRSTTSDTPAR